MPYEVMMYAALACAAVSFTIALILFINLKIPSVIGDLTGSTAKKEIAEMQKEGRIGSSGTSRTSKNEAKGRKKKHKEKPAKHNELSGSTAKLTQNETMDPAPAFEGTEIPQERPVQTAAAQTYYEPVNRPGPEMDYQTNQNRNQMVYPAENKEIAPANNTYNTQRPAAGNASYRGTMAGQTIWINGPGRQEEQGTIVLSSEDQKYPSHFTLLKHVVVVNTQERID